MDAVDTDLINRVPSQIQFTIVGIGVVFIVAAIDYRLLGSLHGFIYGFVLFILGLVAGLGAVGAAGAQSWLNVGLQVQPSELGKMLLVITLGQHLADRYESMDSLRTVLVSLVHVAVPTAHDLYPAGPGHDDGDHVRVVCHGLGGGAARSNIWRCLWWSGWR